MSGGGGTTTSNTSTNIPPEVLAEYKKVTNLGNQAASAPLQQYSGQIVADPTAAENSAYNTINNMQGMTGPVSAADIQRYQSPYTQDVLNSTMAAENNQDAQQQAQLQGNAISAGAWGGDRSGVAQGILGGQQALANNATNAGIMNQGYSQALNEANIQQQSVLQDTLTAANAQLAAGQQQQQQNQAELNVPYEQFLQRQAYPFQTTGWLANIAEGIGSNSGGNSTTTSSQPSGGLFGGLFKRGGGIVPKRGSGGMLPDMLQHGIGAAFMNDYLQKNDNPTTNTIADILGGLNIKKSLARGGIVPHFDSGGAYDDDIMSAISKVESNDNPNAVSPAGAFSQYGIMPATAAKPGFGVQPYRGPGDEARFARDYHDAMLNRYNGDENMALTAYNGGPGRADNVANGNMSMSDLPTETQQYPGKVMAALGQSPDQYQSDMDEATGIKAPPPTPPVNAPDHPSNYTAEIPHTHEANPWLAVAAGVAGTLAGRSRNPLVDIGQGALIGMNNYEHQQEIADKQNYQEGSFQNNAQKLMDEADQTKQKFAQEKTNEADTNEYHKGLLANQKQTLEQGKIGFNQWGQPIFMTGPKAGQAIPQDNTPGGSRPPGMPDFEGVQKVADNIGITPSFISPKNRQDQAAATKIISAAGDNVAASNDAILSLKRVEQLLPTIDQGKMAQAERYGAEVLGVGTPERAAYEELKKLEGNAALQNEVANGIKGRALGFNMVKLGQGLFASPEMAKDAQMHILDKAILLSETAKGANEILPQLEGTTPGTLVRAKEKYYNDSLAKGYAIPSQDYLSGAYKASDYKRASDTTVAPATNAVQTPSNLPPGTMYSPSRKQYRDPSGKLYDSTGRPI